MKLQQLLTELNKYDPEMEVMVDIEGGEDGMTDIDIIYRTEWVEPDNTLQKDQLLIIKTVY